MSFLSHVTFPVHPQPVLRADRSFPTRAACIDRRADLELSLGRTDVAERLSHQAAALRNVAQ